MSASCGACGGPLSCSVCHTARMRHTEATRERLVSLMARSTWPTIQLTSIELTYAIALIGRGWTLADAIDRIQAQRDQPSFTVPEGAQ